MIKDLQSRDRLGETLRAFARDEGSISIEFMIAMPLLIFAVTGGLGYWDAFHSKTQVSRIAFTVNDIMSRHDAVDDTDMAYLASLTDKMMEGDLDQRILRITSICFEDDTHQVLWSFTAQSTDITGPGAMLDEEIPVTTLPEMQPQESVILTEVAARWKPHFVNTGIGEMQWSSQLISRPRFVNIVPHDTLNASNICPTNPTMAGAGGNPLDNMGHGNADESSDALDNGTGNIDPDNPGSTDGPGTNAPVNP
ncbi:MAG: pilus assembly protein [Paracoccaceae bacterium]|nr:pilus assembly protein [Paracoccaceae bacterium]